MSQVADFPTTITIHGQTVRVVPDMFEEPPKPSPVPALALASLGLFGAFKYPARAMKVAGAVAAAGAAALLAMTWKPVSSRAIASVLPAVMKKVDTFHGAARDEILSKALRGKILDFGAGGGIYIPRCSRLDCENGGAVTEYVALEPNRHLHDKIRTEFEKAERRGHVNFPVRLEGCFSDELVARDSERGSYDFIIVGNVLCEVPDPVSVLSDLAALVKPGGAIYFSEHVGAERGTAKRRFQDRANWLWFTVSDGCNCNRDTVDTIKDALAGWDIAAWQRQTGEGLIDTFVLALAIKPLDA